MNPILGRILFGVFAPGPRQVTHYRRRVDDATREAIVEGEHARVTEWIAARGFAERGIVVDTGCAGSSPRGVEITIALRGLVAEPLLVSAKRRAPGHLVDALFDDDDLRGALRAVALTPDGVSLRFYPLRSTGAYDAALRRFEEIIERAHRVVAVRAAAYR